jgi:hypothetical protein
MALVTHNVLEHLNDHPDSPATNVILEAIGPFAIGALLLGAALSVLSALRHASCRRWMIAFLLAAVCIPFNDILGGPAILINVTVLIAAAALWRSARRLAAANSC